MTKATYTRSVIDTARILAECARGSRDGYSSEQLTELAEWLEWRIRVAWLPPGRPSEAGYDEAVHEMARTALELHRRARP